MHNICNQIIAKTSENDILLSIRPMIAHDSQVIQH